jgi:hypothetical protein
MAANAKAKKLICHHREVQVLGLQKRHLESDLMVEWCAHCGAHRTVATDVMGKETFHSRWIPPKPARFYYLCGLGGWFIVRASTRRKAYSVGVQEWGRGHVSECYLAKNDVVDAYIAQRGYRATEG